MEQNIIKNDKNNKIHFIIQTTIVSIILIFCIILLVGILSVRHNPNKEELIYEKVTYIRYEYIRKGTKSVSKRYYIFVNEYDKPLEIDNIVFDKVNRNALDNLISGDVLTVSIREYNDNYDLYSIAMNENYILSYEDYLTCHNRNNTLGLIFFPIVISIAIFILVFGIIRYKKTGECLPI